MTREENKLLNRQHQHQHQHQHQQLEHPKNNQTKRCLGRQKRQQQQGSL